MPKKELLIYHIVFLIFKFLKGCQKPLDGCARSEIDILAGRSAQCQTVLIGNASLSQGVDPDLRAENLFEAVEKIMSRNQ